MEENQIVSNQNYKLIWNAEFKNNFDAGQAALAWFDLKLFPHFVYQ